MQTSLKKPRLSDFNLTAYQYQDYINYKENLKKREEKVNAKKGVLPYVILTLPFVVWYIIHLYSIDCDNIGLSVFFLLMCLYCPHLFIPIILYSFTRPIQNVIEKLITFLYRCVYEIPDRKDYYTNAEAFDVKNEAYQRHLESLNKRFPDIKDVDYNIVNYYQLMYSEILSYELGYIQKKIIAANKKNQEEYWFNLSGNDFEVEVANLYRNLGYCVERTQLVGDGGIDIKLWKSQNEYIIVQCKNHRKKVGPSVVRDLYGVMISEKANKAVLICSGGFTAGVLDFTQGKPIELIDISILLELSRTVNPLKNPTVEICNHRCLNVSINHHVKGISGVMFPYSHYKGIVTKDGKAYYDSPINNLYCIFETIEEAEEKVVLLKGLQNKIYSYDCIYEIAKWKKIIGKTFYYIRVFREEDKYLQSIERDNYLPYSSKKRASTRRYKKRWY